MNRWQSVRLSGNLVLKTPKNHTVKMAIFGGKINVKIY